ncbi:unnamed protein product [Schistocephalus solidus]|uniref:Carb-bd_dom_fam9 domain-containing protein n=1 Tax=Schistocephalus solidus TaxID=70667 RepID=A0A183S9R4_SCHSO|nr:unnamed protein product [Schistocephalus solidus]
MDPSRIAKFASIILKFDWFQLPDIVNISVYAKNTLPETVKVQCNGVFLTVYFVYDAGKAHYDHSFNLLGVK